MNAWTEKAKASFWSKVDQSGGPAACWPWKRSRTGTGYGQVNMGKSHGPSLRAHRVAFELTNGSIPAGGRGKHGTCVLHSCDNRLCCNPKHLRHGTQGENIQEMFKRGRGKLPPRVTPEMRRRNDTYPKLVEDRRKLIEALRSVTQYGAGPGKYGHATPSRDQVDTARALLRSMEDA